MKAKTPLGAKRRNLHRHIFNAREERKRMSTTTLDHIGHKLGPWNDLYETEEGAMFEWTRGHLTLLVLITPAKSTVVELYDADEVELIQHHESTMLTREIEAITAQMEETK